MIDNNLEILIDLVESIAPIIIYNFYVCNYDDLNGFLSHLDFISNLII